MKRFLFVQNLFHLVHDPVHLDHGEFEGFGGGHVDSGLLQKIDRVVRAARRQEVHIPFRRFLVAAEDPFREGG